MHALSADIERRLAAGAPEIELLLAEVVAGDRLRLYIDRPGGVTLADCELVTRLLAEYRDRFTLEVSSPGESRPLTKPEHFSRHLGRRARLRLHEPWDGQKTLTGELVGASVQQVTIAAPEGVVSIPYELIARSNLVPGD